MNELLSAQRSIEIMPMTAEDWPAVRAIYLEGIATGDATFEQDAPEWEAWHARHRADCRLIACRGAEILGWAALSSVSMRAVYAGVAEVSIYVAERARGRQVGDRLLSALVAASEQAGVWTLQAGIFPENIASLRLHESCGFRMVGVREKLGTMNGRWRDVMLLERRRRDSAEE